MASNCVKDEYLQAMNHCETSGAFLPLIWLDAMVRDWFQKYEFHWLLRMHLDFNAKQGRASSGSECTYSLNGVHWLRLHPLNAPPPRMNRLVYAWLVSDAAIRPMITDMRRRPSCIPTKKEAWPTVVMHGFRRAGRRHGDFKHTHECVFENHFVTVGCGLRSIVAVGKVGLVLSIRISMPGEQRQGANNQNSKPSTQSIGEDASFLTRAAYRAETLGLRCLSDFD